MKQYLSEPSQPGVQVELGLALDGKRAGYQSRQQVNRFSYRSGTGAGSTQERRPPSIEGNDGHSHGTCFRHDPSGILVHAGEEENIRIATHQCKQP